MRKHLSISDRPLFDFGRALGNKSQRPNVDQAQDVNYLIAVKYSQTPVSYSSSSDQYRRISKGCLSVLKCPAKKWKMGSPSKYMRLLILFHK